MIRPDSHVRKFYNESFRFHVSKYFPREKFWGKTVFWRKIVRKKNHVHVNLAFQFALFLLLIFERISRHIKRFFFSNLYFASNLHKVLRTFIGYQTFRIIWKLVRDYNDCKTLQKRFCQLIACTYFFFSFLFFFS